MAATQEFVGAVVAAIDPPTAMVIVALITAAGAVATRWAPKTRSESAVDHASAHFDEAQSWALLIEQHRKDADMWRADVATLRAELAERDQRIEELEAEVGRLRVLINRA